MGRFYLQIVQRLLIAYVYFQKAEETVGKDAILTTLQPHREADATNRDVFYSAYRAYQTPLEGDDLTTHASVVASLFGQLRRTKQDDTDLITTIVKVLGLPASMNRFSGLSLKGLRDVIMRPSELVEWRKVALKEIRCKCGTAFEHGEMVTITLASGDPLFQCHKCVRPVYARCDYCTSNVELVGANATRHLKEIDCGCRKRAERAAQVAAAGGPATTPLRTQNDVLQRLMRDQRRAAHATVHPAAAPGQTLRWVEATAPAQVITVANPFDDDAEDDDGGF